jgi:hypothetical protein
VFSLSALELLVVTMWVAGVVAAIRLPTSWRVRLGVLLVATAVPIAGSAAAVVIALVARERGARARSVPPPT